MKTLWLRGLIDCKFIIRYLSLVSYTIAVVLIQFLSCLLLFLLMSCCSRYLGQERTFVLYTQFRNYCRGSCYLCCLFILLSYNVFGCIFLIRVIFSSVIYFIYYSEPPSLSSSSSNLSTWIFALFVCLWELGWFLGTWCVHLACSTVCRLHQFKSVSFGVI